MRRLEPLIALASLLTASSAGAQTPSTAPCDEIAARIQAEPDADTWAVLTRQSRPVIGLATTKESGSMAFDPLIDDEQDASRFVVQFNPAAELLDAWIEAVGSGRTEIAALAGSDLRVIVTTGGSALCYSFTFFRQSQGSPAQLLPGVPPRSDRDGENAICGKSGNNGHLARVGGMEAFVETRSSDTGHFIRVVPLRSGRWSNACAIDAQYATAYVTTKVFVAEDGPVSASEFRSAAAQLAQRRDTVSDMNEFLLGSTFPSSELQPLRDAADVLAKLDAHPMPAFGRAAELATGEETVRTGNSIPIQLAGKGYLLQIGSGQLGCCHFPGPMLILYALRDGKPEPVASAIVERSRGPLKSVRSYPSR